MTCNKCHQSQARDGDTWCLACSAWETLGQELTSRWSCSSSRWLADDLVLSVTRQVRFLRNLSAGIRANAEAAAGRSDRPVAAGKRAREEHDDKPVLQRRKEANQQHALDLQPKRRSDRLSKEVLSDTDEDSEEEEVVETTHKPLPGSNDRKPPEPKGPPPSRRPPVAKEGQAQSRKETPKDRKAGTRPGASHPSQVDRGIVGQSGIGAGAGFP